MFRIQSLTLLHHHVLGDIHLEFCREDQQYTEGDIYSTVIIGVNGIGKSHILRAIADIFCCLEALINAEEGVIKNGPSFKFLLKYYINGNLYEFANFDEITYVDGSRKSVNRYNCRSNGERIPMVFMRLPERVIASTMTITDRFNTKGTERYLYKGIRNETSPGLTGTRTMIRKTVSSILQGLDIKEGFRSELIMLLDVLGLEPMLEVTYTIKYWDVFFKEKMNSNELIYIFTHQNEFFKNRETRLWGSSNFKKIMNDPRKMEVAAAFLRKYAYLHGENARGITINYKLLDGDEIIRDREAIEILSSIDILSFPKLSVYKKNHLYEFSESSSGETNILCQMLGIMSVIEHDSLVMIDEPENSAHPNWQINYIEWLKSIFKTYSDCHFMIATHSHFLLSELQPESSDIVALEKQYDGQLRDVFDGVNTFNWTVDDILYEVFHIRNERNEALKRDLERAFQIIDEKIPMNKEEVDKLLNRFNNIYRGDRDPLGKLINELKEYAESRLQ